MYWYYIFVAILISIKVLVWIFIYWYRTHRRQQQGLYRANRIHQSNQVFVVQSGGLPNIGFSEKKAHWEELLRSVSDFISANTADAHPGVSGVSNDQKFCEKFKNTHCQVNHPAKIE